MARRRRRGRRREDGAVEPEIATGPRPESRHFFKIILSDTLESGKLGIPKSFLRRCGKDLSNSVLLRVPGGSTWTIELEKRNNDMVSLWKGWGEFTEYYSIDHGHLIVFEYKGNSTFCVIIFNKSASEIDYSLSGGKRSNIGSKFPSIKTEDVIEAEDQEDLTPRRRMRVEPYLPYSHPSPIFSPRGSKDGIRQSRCKVNRPEPVFGGPTRIGPLSGFELTGKFESRHPFFMVKIQPSYLKHSLLCVPRKFIMQHIPKIKEIATLRHSGRSWPVKLRSYGYHGARFASGWLAFVREAHLRLWNVCVFQLIDGDDVVFRVYIVNGAGGKKQSKCTASLSEPVFHGPTPLRPLTTPELANEFDPEHPFFKLVIPQYQTNKLNVPIGFARKYIQESVDMVMLRYLDRLWPVKLLRYKQDHEAFFSGGWPAFARENCLRVGDVCMFELTDRDDFVFKVSIFRSAACIDADPKEPDLSQASVDTIDRIQQSTCKVSHSEMVFHGPTLPRTLTPPELARKFDSEHPFFEVLIRQSHMSCLSIPLGFIKQHIQEKKGIATLRFSGKSWLVKLLSYTETKNDKKILRVFFSTGWPAFARETHMRVGKTCAFELLDRDDVVFRVSIFSSAACIDTDPQEPDLSQAPADSTDGIQQSTCRVSHSKSVFHGPTLPRPLTPSELARKFDSEHPFFKVVIRRSHMSCLSIPLGFIKQHIQEKKGMATLRFSGKSWPVRLSSYTETRKNKKLLSCTYVTRVFFYTGWPAFARETHMRLGNICAFELINRNDVVFQVSIFSSAGGIEQSTCRASRSKPGFRGSPLPRSLTSPELASNINTEHPFFKLVFRQSYMTYMVIPVGFAKRHLQENKQMATLWYSDRSWPVKLISTCGQARKTPCTFFSAGWGAFAKETHLCAGNVCMFQLIDGDHTVFKVFILSGTDNDPIHID